MAEVTEKLPGMRAVYSQPIEMRINEMVAGHPGRPGHQALRRRPGGPEGEGRRDRAGRQGRSRARPTSATEQITGLPVLRIEVDREALSRYGVPARQVLDAVKAAGGIKVGEVLEPGRRFPLVVRLPDVVPRRPAGPGEDPDPDRDRASGCRSPGSPALEETTGPSTIQREWGQRRIVVQANVRGRDIGSFVEEAQERIGREVKLADRLHASSGAASSRT